ncbi:MAG: hypothetical protein HY294_15185 [Candidatus Rokubacteria bacterium]|nr:hypothetical protein [Candidatus Rokubacteria bacterium]
MRQRLALVVVGGVAGSGLFWLVQVMTGGPTITAFMGEQVAAAGGYPATLAPAFGWIIHVAVGLSYASLFGVVVAPLRLLPRAALAGTSLVMAIVFGWLTTAIAPSAISVTVGLLGHRRWPAEIFPLNWDVGLPFWNHQLFFLANWIMQVLGGMVVRARARSRRRSLITGREGQGERE